MEFSAYEKAHGCKMTPSETHTLCPSPDWLCSTQDPQNLGSSSVPRCGSEGRLFLPRKGSLIQSTFGKNGRAARWKEGSAFSHLPCTTLPLPSQPGPPVSPSRHLPAPTECQTLWPERCAQPFWQKARCQASKLGLKLVNPWSQGKVLLSGLLKWVQWSACDASIPGWRVSKLGSPYGPWAAFCSVSDSLS
jgi:hypothetical protein